MIAPNRMITGNKSNETQKQTKWIEIHLSQTMTFWTCSSKHVFSSRSAKMIDATEKPKIPSKNKTVFGDLPLSLVRIVQNFFTAGFDFGQPRHCQKIFWLDLHKCHDEHCITFRKMVCNVFWTGSEYKVTRNFIV